MSIEDIGIYATHAKHIKGRESIEPIHIKSHGPTTALRQLPRAQPVRVKPVGLKCNQCTEKVRGRDEFRPIGIQNHHHDDDEHEYHPRGYEHHKQSFHMQNRMHSNVEVEYSSKGNVQAKMIGSYAKMSSADALQNAIKASRVPVIVLFYANWCGYCTKFKPIFEKLSKELKINVKFYAIEASDFTQDDLNTIGADVKGYPTVGIFYNKRWVYIGHNRDDKNEYIHLYKRLTDPEYEEAYIKEMEEKHKNSVSRPYHIGSPLHENQTDSDSDSDSSSESSKDLDSSSESGKDSDSDSNSDFD